MNNKRAGLIALVASLTMAAVCWSLPTPPETRCAASACAGLAQGSRTSPAGTDLTNPKKDDDDAGNESGDATPVPEPQPIGN